MFHSSSKIHHCACCGRCLRPKYEAMSAPLPVIYKNINWRNASFYKNLVSGDVCYKPMLGLSDLKGSVN